MTNHRHPFTRTARPAALPRKLVGFALLAVLALASLSNPYESRAIGPLPACRYDDIRTRPDAYHRWRVTLVDTILRVRKGYVPPNLVPVTDAGVPGDGRVRRVMLDDLRELAADARAADAAFGVESAYRSFKRQRRLFDTMVAAFGRREALKVVARPGHSEHQLGLALDFRSHPGAWEPAGDWGTTPAGIWLAANAWKYGFVMSYPPGTLSTTCYAYEPWHYRYVGREHAADIEASGQTLREYLWARHTKAEVP